MREIELAVGEYYHLFNRGVNKQNIFHSRRDWIRFLFNILYFQSPRSIMNIDEKISHFFEKGFFNLEAGIEAEVIDQRFVELTSFALMPNHFHLIVLGKAEKGISRYMQRVLNSYTKYFNIKYKKSGHLFQGPFKVVRIANNEQLLYLSASIHRNPREFKSWRGREEKYFWSSYQDFILKNRWGKLLVPEVIAAQFTSPGEYRRIVEESGAKEFVDPELLLDA